MCGCRCGCGVGGAVRWMRVSVYRVRGAEGRLRCASALCGKREEPSHVRHVFVRQGQRMIDASVEERQLHAPSPGHSCMAGKSCIAQTATCKTEREPEN